jgi:hypothetical protein
MSSRPVLRHSSPRVAPTAIKKIRFEGCVQIIGRPVTIFGSVTLLRELMLQFVAMSYSNRAGRDPGARRYRTASSVKVSLSSDDDHCDLGRHRYRDVALAP